MKWRFALKFLLSFAVFLMLWGVADLPTFYRRATLATVQQVSPAVSGWVLDYDLPGMKEPVVFRWGGTQLPMLIQLPALSMGLVPLLSLIVATPGLGLKRAVLALGLGILLYFVLDVIVVLAYPLIMHEPNAVKDTLGVFTGLVAFAVAPLALWFALTYPTLRSLWQLGPTSSRRPA